jgi:hypothetical protein
MGRRRVNPLIFLSPQEEGIPLPPLRPYVRCTCGLCRECHDNEKWDRVFAKFEVKEAPDVRGFFRSPLNDL